MIHDVAKHGIQYRRHNQEWDFCMEQCGLQHRRWMFAVQYDGYFWSLDLEQHLLQLQHERPITPRS